MLAPFIQAYCNDKFEEVYRLMGSEVDKSFRWKVILEEYSWLMKNEDGDHFLQLFEKILVLNSEIIFVEGACNYLTLCLSVNKTFDQEVVEKLCNIFPADYTDKKNIELTIIRLDTKVYEKSILEDEYLRIQAVNSKSGRMTEDSFLKNVAGLSKYQGGGFINLNTTSVKLYAASYQNYITETKIKSKDG